MSNTQISQVFSPLKTNGHCLGLGDFEEYGCILMPGNPLGAGNPKCVEQTVYAALNCSPPQREAS